MIDDIIIPFICTLAILFFAFMIGFTGFIIGCGKCNTYWKTQMIEKNVGEYYLDENHNMQFRIIEVK